MTPDRTDIRGRNEWHRQGAAEAEARYCGEALTAHRDPTDLDAQARLRTITDEIANHHSAIANLNPFA